jgi:hypothetical protein
MHSNAKVFSQHPVWPQFLQSKFIQVRRAECEDILQKLDISTATGHDGVPARILKLCAAQLLLPLALLTRSILHQGQWPVIWKKHRVVPLFKKGSTADPNNYRDVHLTPVLSKCVERAVGRSLTTYLQKSGAYGSN